MLAGELDVPISRDHDRSVGPGETVARLRPHFAGLGITRLGDITALDEVGIPIALATRPNSFSLSVSLGKGPDRDSAFASAAMEAAEMAVAEQLPSSLIQASVRELKAAAWPHLDLGRVARCQPARLDGDERIAWVEGSDLIAGRPLLVPWALVGLDHRLAPAGYHDAFEVSSDGLASGNTPAEAALHGICELIERDAYSLVHLLPGDRLRQRCRSISKNGGGALQQFVAAIEGAGLRVQLIEMQNDVGVPAYMAVLVPALDSGELAVEGPALCGGCGCHPSAERAAIRAVTEAAQSRLALIAGGRDDLLSANYGSGSAPRRPIPSGLSPELGDLPPASLFAYPQGMGHTIGDCISLLLQQLRAAGVSQVIVVQLDAEAFGISVVRVIIPDLQIPLHGYRTQVSRRGLRSIMELAA